MNVIKKETKIANYFFECICHPLRPTDNKPITETIFGNIK